MSDEREVTIQVLSDIGEIDAAMWDRNANPDPKTYDPFVSHAFLKALEDAQCVRAETGWQPQHLILSGASGEIDGCMPVYAKSHSKGEYVFDYGWADAYENAGGDYYPKLLSAVPFTPVPGRRLLTTMVLNKPSAEGCSRPVRSNSSNAMASPRFISIFSTKPNGTR